MTRRGMTHEQLVTKLAEIEPQEEPKNVRNNVAPSGFSAVFFVQCLRAIGCDVLRLSTG